MNVSLFLIDSPFLIIKQNNNETNLADPALFEEKINEALGPNYPYFASIGNHDLLRWNGYSKNLEARLARFNATSNCVGDYGVKMTCDWNG